MKKLVLIAIWAAMAFAACPASSLATPSGFTVAPTPFGPHDAMQALTAADHAHVWVVGTDLTEGAWPLVWYFNGSTWQKQSVPVPAGAMRGELIDVAEAGPDNVWAVGYYSDSADRTTLLVERFDGSAWHRLEPVGVKLHSASSISVRSATDIWLLGRGGSCNSRHDSAYHFDGITWKRKVDLVDSCNNQDAASLSSVASIAPRTGLVLGGQTYHEVIASIATVDCAGPRCPGPAPREWADLNATVGTASDLWVIGSRWTIGEFGDPVRPQEPLAWHWDGLTWTDASPATVYPEDHELFGAAKLSDGSVWAVGGRSGTTGNRTLIMRHDAVAGWSDLGGPNPSADDYLVDLAHVPGTGTEMWALGTDRTTYGSFLLYHP